MFRYILRRIAYALPILIGVNILTFALFFLVNTPDDIAYLQLGAKHVSAEDIQAWKEARGYHLPLFYNSSTASFKDTIFWQKSVRLFAFDFGNADSGASINKAIATRYAPSLIIAIPTLLLGITVNLCMSLLVLLYHRTIVDSLGVVAAVALMSISGLFYIIGAQFIVAKLWRWVPISGFSPGFAGFKFLLLPIAIGVISGIGSGMRWYRAIFLDELHKDYVRTARAKGLSELAIMFRHVLPNGLIPILTGLVVILPLLFMGSLLIESFFAIPGLGSYTIDAIASQDFAIVRAMVFLGSSLYIVGLVLTDISYVLVDPRVRLSNA